MKKKIILDIEYTLIDIEHINDRIPIINYDNSFIIDYSQNKFIIYKRPYLNFFLIEIYKYFDIYSYTSSKSTIFMNMILDQIEKDVGCIIFKQRLFSDCLLFNESFTVNFDYKSTIIIDDMPEKHYKQFYNVINIPSWISIEKEDDKLIEVLNVIKTLIYTDDVRYTIKLYNENNYPYIYNFDFLQKHLNLDYGNLIKSLYRN